jgi:hypothetical protein
MWGLKTRSSCVWIGALAARWVNARRRNVKERRMRLVRMNMFRELLVFGIRKGRRLRLVVGTDGIP